MPGSSHAWSLLGFFFYLSDLIHFFPTMLLLFYLHIFWFWNHRCRLCFSASATKGVMTNELNDLVPIQRPIPLDRWGGLVSGPPTQVHCFPWRQNHVSSATSCLRYEGLIIYLLFYYFGLKSSRSWNSMIRTEPVFCSVCLCWGWSDCLKRLCLFWE